MNKPSRLSDEDRADLVAYLDGELKGQAARTIEERLSRDETVRDEAAALKRTWDLLDFLPTPEPSPNFTNRTLSSVRPLQPAASKSASVIKEPAANYRPERRWQAALVGSAWVLSLLLSGGIGYLGYERLVPARPITHEEESTPQAQPSPGILPDPPASTSEPRPTTYADLPVDVQHYVNNKLWPALLPREQKALQAARRFLAPL